MNIIESAKSVPVIYDADICVLGGSCTGVFAAVRAARLGAKVVIVEKQNSFGGMATQAMVNIWHSLLDDAGKKQIVAGLTWEVIQRLKKRGGAIKPNDEGADSKNYHVLNTEELKIELDELIRENNIKPYLHTFYCAPYVKDGVLEGVFVENKDGRGVILAKQFIDATGDGDLCHDLSFRSYTRPNIQPPTACAKIYKGAPDEKELINNIVLHREEYGLPEDWGWRDIIPGMPDIKYYCYMHIFGADCSKADDLTFAEMEGRRQIRGYLDIMKKYCNGGREAALVAIGSALGVRETRHFICRYRINGEDISYGRPCKTPVAHGCYPIDIHSADRPGITFRYLNGTEVYKQWGKPNIVTKWRNTDTELPLYWSVPFEAIVPDEDKFGNVMLCGRMLDCDTESFGAVRIMISLNQLGEAAGTASYLALDSRKKVGDIDTGKLKKLLVAGGSADVS
ncbi:MAG TPA: FAD-dependent oxidoreductase [Clostridiaceae bacterium]|nr:FAD-dependent oxidoreductase [Clostridiaceae bacterium]